jgi:transmembrane sensor
VLQDGRDNRKRELISQEAAEWFARMQDPGVSLDYRRRFLRWLKESPVHIAEYLTIADMNGDLQRVQLTAVLGDDAGAASNVIKLDTHADGQASRTRDVRLSGWKVAAAIAAFAVAVLLFVVARPAWHERSIATEPGQWTTQTLADGSEVQLGPNTLLQVDLGEARRAVVLARGEAYFEVAKDPARPFFVQADAFAVRATGTEFAVARRKSELIVTVAEGSVRVAPRSRSAGGDELSVPIAADQQLRIADAWPATPRQVDVHYELAWRERQLMFRAGDTLADAVEEFNLRNRIQLRLDPRAAAVPVRGIFDASDPAAFARIMDGIAPVAIARLSPNLLRIQPE